MTSLASRVGTALAPAARQLGPFVAVALGAVAMVPQPASGAERTCWLLAVAAIGVAMGLCGAAAVLPRGRALWLPAALLHLLSVALLRHAAGGATGGVGFVVVLPVVWFALHGSRRELAVVLAGVAAVWAVPLIAIGAPAYPSGGWRGLVLLTTIAALTGIAIQAVVARDRLHVDGLVETARERDALLAKLEVLVNTDPLTGLPNRRAWTELLEATFASPPAAPCCLAVVDLDDLKGINDRGGHHAGDRLLRAAAARWRHALRPGDVIARLGGDEFGVLLLDCDLDTARLVLRRLRDGVTPCSVGVAQWDGAEDVAALEARADAALYAAKRGGGARLEALPA